MGRTNEFQHEMLYLEHVLICQTTSVPFVVEDLTIEDYAPFTVMMSIVGVGLWFWWGGGAWSVFPIKFIFQTLVSSIISWARDTPVPC